MISHALLVLIHMLTACTNKFKELNSQWCYLIYFLPVKNVSQYEILMYEILVLIENTNWRKFTLFNGHGSACIHFNLEQNSHKDILKHQIKKKMMQYILCINFSDIKTDLINLIKTYISGQLLMQNI